VNSFPLDCALLGALWSWLTQLAIWFRRQNVSGNSSLRWRVRRIRTLQMRNVLAGDIEPTFIAPAEMLSASEVKAAPVSIVPPSQPFGQWIFTPAVVNDSAVPALIEVETSFAITG
jgi:hypothetical protein